MLDRTAFETPSSAAAWVTQLIESHFADGLAAAREPETQAPRQGEEGMRQAYLGLLKLCLCDLIGTTTMSVARTRGGGGEVMSRELSGDQLRLRAAGMDWPLTGLSMIGLARLDDLQRCVESVVADDVPGDLIEAGTWRGGASILMRATLDSLGATDRELWVADSFQGFPAAEHDADPLTAELASFDFLAVPVDEVRASFARLGLDHGVRFVPGFFEETLPGLAGRRWSLMRLDGDTYASTRVALESLYPGLSAGGYIVIDDYLALEECRQAVDEFRAEHGIEDPIEEIDWSGVRWRRTSGGPEAHAAAPEPPPIPQAQPQAVARAPRARVPAMEEVDLLHALERQRERFGAELDRLTGSPWAGPRAWLGRVLRGDRRREP